MITSNKNSAMPCSVTKEYMFRLFWLCLRSNEIRFNAMKSRTGHQTAGQVVANTFFKNVISCAVRHDPMLSAAPESISAGPWMPLHCVSYTSCRIIGRSIPNSALVWVGSPASFSSLLPMSFFWFSKSRGKSDCEEEKRCYSNSWGGYCGHSDRCMWVSTLARLWPGMSASSSIPTGEGNMLNFALMKQVPAHHLQSHLQLGEQSLQPSSLSHKWFLREGRGTTLDRSLGSCKT